MADNRIAGLTAITDIQPLVDLIPIVDVSDNQATISGTTKKITISQILAAGGNVVLPQGTAAAPAASFTGDGNTGIFSTGADIFGISVGGVTSATFSNTGLQVTGTVSGTRLISTVATGVAPLSITSTTLVSNLNADLLDGQQASYFLNTSSEVQTKVGTLNVTDSIATINLYGSFAAFQTAGGIGYRWTLSNDGSFKLQYTTDGFSSVATPRIHVSSAGQIGIGVAPSGQGGGGSIQMANASAIISQGKNFSIVTNGYFDTSWKCYANGNFTQYYASDGKHIWWNGSGTTAALTPVQAMTLDASGRLGIGTASPLVDIHVERAGQAELRLKNTSVSGNAAISLVGGSQTNPWYIYTDASRNLIFQDYTTERLRIDASGNLALGSSSSFNRAQFQGAGQATTSVADNGDGSAVFLADTGAAANNGGLLLMGASVNNGMRPQVGIKSALNDGTANGTGDMAFLTRTTTAATTLTEKMRLTTAGSLGLGTNTPNYKLEVATAIDTAGISLTTAYGAAAERYAALRFTNSSFGGGHSEIRNVVNGVTSLGSSLTFWTASGATGNIAERLRIDSSGYLYTAANGRIGVGVVPTDSLDVNGGIKLSGGSSGRYINFSNTGTNGTFPRLAASLKYTTGSYAGASLIESYITGAFDDRSDLRFYTFGGNERLRIDIDGNIGIGTSSPVARLQVEIQGSSILSSVLAKMGGGDNDFKLVARNGNGAAVPNAESARFGLEYQPGSSSGTFNSGIRFFRGGGASDGYMIFATSGVDRMTFTSAGVAQFASNISMNAGYQFQSTDGTVSLPGFSFSADTNTGIYRPTTDSIGLVTNGAERLRADASGNVIVNTAALATNATSGFLWIPSCAGTPTGAPTAPYTNAAALVWDRTNKKLFVYDGSWNQAIPAV